MNKRVIAAILACLVLALVTGVAACGSGSVTTTGAPATTATTAAPTTTAAPATTAAPSTTTTGAGATTTTLAAGSFTVPSLEMTPEVQTYIQQMQQWIVTLNAFAATSDQLDITDVSKVTDAQIKAAETFDAQFHTALDQLKAIKAPAQLQTIQQNLVQFVSASVDAVDKAVQAIKDKDQAALDAAENQATGLDTQLTNLLQSLLPLIMGGTTTPSS